MFVRFGKYAFEGGNHNPTHLSTKRARLGNSRIFRALARALDAEVRFGRQLGSRALSPLTSAVRPSKSWPNINIFRCNKNFQKLQPGEPVEGCEAQVELLKQQT